MTDTPRDFETELYRSLRRCEGFAALGMWDDALKEVEGLGEVWKADLQVMAWKLEIHCQIGNGPRTRKVCAEILTKNPRNSAAVVLVTECFIKCHKMGRGPQQYSTPRKRTAGMLWLDLVLTRAQSGHVKGSKRALDQYLRWPFVHASV